MNIQKAINKDKEIAVALDGLMSTGGGKLFRGELVDEACAIINKIISNYQVLSHTEYIHNAAKLASHIEMLQRITNTSDKMVIISEIVQQDAKY